ncbi:MAG: HEPN domain-containing protein [Thermoplasmata archaeon]|nr:HEPN domain-containing protein [Thermoplasmata archaeon]
MARDRTGEARNWYTQARSEFRDALDLEVRGRYYLALYLYQQSAEKALKAFLFDAGEEELFTHSVKDLLGLATSIDPDLGDLKPSGKLDMYYIPTRYPNGLAGDVPAEFFDDPEECEMVRELSRAVMEAVAERLGEPPP